MVAEQLRHMIEEYRQKMIDLACDSSMLDTKVIEASIELDALINKYLMLTKS
jgi:hypothetical protein